MAEICVPQSTQHTSKQAFTTSDLPAKLQPKVRVNVLRFEQTFSSTEGLSVQLPGELLLH